MMTDFKLRFMAGFIALICFGFLGATPLNASEKIRAKISEKTSEKTPRKTTLETTLKTTPAIQKLTSPNGLKVWFVQDKSLPIMQISMAWRMAWRGVNTARTPEKAGAARFLSTLLDEGAGDYDALSFQEKLADDAIQLRFQAGRDNFFATLKYLNRNQTEANNALELLRLAITSPRFDAEAMTRMRTALLVGLRRAQSDPSTLARDAWWAHSFKSHAAHPSPHPYGSPVDGTAQSLTALSRDDLENLRRRLLTRDNLVIAAIGNAEPAALLAHLDRVFAALPSALASMPVLPTKAQPPHAPPHTSAQKQAPITASSDAVQHIEFDSPQTEIIFGHAGLGYDDPDFYAAHVMNYILGGGGFASRLTEELREKRGLTYGVSSYLYPLDYSALWLGGLSTTNENLDDALAIIRAQMRRMQIDGVTARELTTAKNYLIGSYPLRFDSGRKIVSQLLAMQLNGFPANYGAYRAGKINAVTRADIKRVAQRILKPDGLLIVTVGKKTDTPVKPAPRF